MRIVVIGGTGLIGSKLVKTLEAKGHAAVAAAPNTGVNTITGEGLKEALSGAQVVVDLANAPLWEDRAVLEFFETSGRNLMAAEKTAGVKHHLALSIVGSDRNPDSGYLRAKMAQENLIKSSGIPYTILRSTQFFEFRRHRQIGRSGRRGAAVPRAVPADRLGRRGRQPGRADAGAAAERHGRGCGPGGAFDGQVRAQIFGRDRLRAQGDP